MEGLVLLILAIFMWIVWHVFAFIAKWGERFCDWIEGKPSGQYSHPSAIQSNNQTNFLTYANFLNQFTNQINRYLSFSERQSATDKCIRQASSALGYDCSRYRELTLQKLVKLNEDFLQKEAQRCNYFFSDILGHSLDKQQREAILLDEDRQLIVAGAGSGKTLTIVGKVAYLVKMRQISPEEILLISFTRKATEEMTERVSRQLGVRLNAFTFHKLGRKIITDSTGESSNVADENTLNKIINRYYKSAFEAKNQAASNLLDFLAYFLYIPEDKQKFKTLDEFYAAERETGLETLKSKYTNRKNLPDKQSIYGEKMKSFEEVLIANFLFLNGIKYEYEHPYPYKWYGYGTYKPDFYLPDYDIYLEHFGVDKFGKCNWLRYPESKKYEKEMFEKERLHEDMGTTLLKTYSYYQSEGILLDKLEEILKENGVKFNEVSKETILKEIFLRQDRGLIEFNRLISDFIRLFKAQGYSFADLNSWKNKYISNKYFSERTKLFLTIVSDIYREYETVLSRKDSIDFSDMITDATVIVNSHRNRHLPYKYIIIDEYQDMGRDRYNLVKAIVDSTGAKLVCIGDDWQSIYRFTGSDISLFTSFEKYWGQHILSRIEKTYRNSQRLIDVCGKFIMSNKKQISKALISNKWAKDPIKKICYGKDNQIECLEKIFEDIYENSGMPTVFLLGRNNDDIRFLENGSQSNCSVSRLASGEIKIRYNKRPSLDISFLTVHGAKGLEADNVVIINCKNDISGFPNKIADDPILQLLLSEPDDFRYAEERRLMYVALTRTKNRTYLLVPENNPSEFVTELDNIGISSLEHEHTALPQYTCARCGGVMKLMTRKADGHKFYGCSNYPRCSYTIDNSDDDDSFSEETAQQNTLLKPLPAHQRKRNPVSESTEEAELSILETRVEDVRFVCLDVETTGLDCKEGDRICEIGLSTYVDGVETSSYSMLINPQRRIPSYITTLTGISNEMVANKPCFEEIVPQVLSEIKNAVIVCHNAPFDIAFMKEEFQQIGLSFPNNPIVDTLKLARKYANFPSNALQDIAKHLDIEPPEAHRALADAQTTQQVLNYFLFMLREEKGIKTLGDLLALQDPSKTPKRVKKAQKKKSTTKTTQKKASKKVAKRMTMATKSRKKSH